MYRKEMEKKKTEQSPHGFTAPTYLTASLHKTHHVMLLILMRNN